ncbi:MAG: hypothetical protein ACR2N3_05600 [Pyrinomonadaceae bacterium]
MQNGGDPTAACGMMGCGVVIYLLVMLGIVAAGIAVTVFIIRWIGRDATARGMANANSIKWLGLLGLLGLLIYVLQRPQGNVMPCPHCGKPRMQGTPRCPHCGQP